MIYRRRRHLIPIMLSYDSCNLETGEVPRDSFSRFTIMALKHAFFKISVELGDDDKIMVDSEPLEGLTAYPNSLKYKDKLNFTWDETVEIHYNHIETIINRIYITYKGDKNNLPLDIN